MAKVLRRTIIPRPFEDVVRELLLEGWKPQVTKCGGVLFTRNPETLAKVMKKSWN